MPFNGSGSFSPPGANYPAVANTTAAAADRNAVDADFATGLSTAICKDGQTTVTADIPFNDNKLTGVKLATASADAMTLANFQAQTGVYVGTVGGTADAIELTPSPAITAYAAGQRFSFIASGANTGATTVDVSAVGAKNVTKNGATALVANDILSSQLVTIEYDGTQFQVVGRVDAALYLKVADLLDEDDMASDSATKPASQQSIKAYADNSALSYSTGTFTPRLWDNSLSDAEGQTYGPGNFGKYRRVGDMVFIYGTLQMSSLGSLGPTSIAYMNCEGLPYTPVESGIMECLMVQGSITAGTNIVGQMSLINQRMGLWIWDVTAGCDTLQIQDLTATAGLSFSGFFIV